MRRLIRWLARNEIRAASNDGYLRGLNTGREEGRRWACLESCCNIYDPGC